MKHLIINKHEVSLPESWAEVTWKQGRELILLSEKEIQESRVIIHTVAILTGLPLSFWEQFTDLAKYQALANSLDWAFNYSLYEKQVEKMKEASWRTFKYKGKDYTMPYDLGNLTTAQFEDGKMIAQKMQPFEQKGEKIELNAEELLLGKKNLFCVYFQPLIDGNYDYGKAVEFDVDQIPFVSVNRWADFFLKKLIDLSNGTRPKRKFWDILQKRASQATPS